MKALPLIVNLSRRIFVFRICAGCPIGHRQRACAPRTEPALACLLGFQGPEHVGAQQRCLNHFFERGTLASSYGVGSSVGPIGYCAQQYFRQERNYCPHGPLEAVDYLGTNAAGNDVYDAQYMNADVVYIIPPPWPGLGSPAGTGLNRVRRGSIVPASLVQVTSPATDKIALYRRPWSW